MKIDMGPLIGMLTVVVVLFCLAEIAEAACDVIPKEECGGNCPFGDTVIASLNTPANQKCWNNLNEDQLLSNMWRANNLQYIDSAKLKNVLAKINPPIDFKLTNNKGKLNLYSDGSNTYVQGDFGKIDINRFNNNNGYSIDVTDNKVTIKCNDLSKCGGKGLTLPPLGKDVVIKADDKNNVVIDLSNTAIPAAGFLFDIPGGGTLTLITKAGEYLLQAPSGEASAVKLKQDQITLAKNIDNKVIPIYAYYKPKNGDRVIIYGDFKIFNNGLAVIYGNNNFKSYYINLNTNIGVTALPTNIGKAIYINGGRISPGDGEVTYQQDGTIYAKTGAAGLQMFKIYPLSDNINQALEQNSFGDISKRFDSRKNMWTGYPLPPGGPNTDSVFHYNPAKNEVISAKGIFNMVIYDNPNTLRPVVGVNTLARDSRVDPSKIVVAYNKDNSGALYVNMEGAQTSAAPMGVADINLYYLIPNKKDYNIDLNSNNPLYIRAYVQNGAINIDYSALKTENLNNAIFLKDFQINNGKNKLGEIVKDKNIYYLRFYNAKGEATSSTQLNTELNRGKLDPANLLTNGFGISTTCAGNTKTVYNQWAVACNYKGSSGKGKSTACACEDWKCGILDYVHDNAPTSCKRAQ